MVALIIVVRYLPEPWRAILDFCIAVALALGFYFILLESLRHKPGD
jgi:multisubunit Na+/H+ antiporter MnhB subunit